jgi:hypothetical protein
MFRKQRLLWIAALGLISASGVGAQAPVKLVINGNAVSTQSRSIGGKTWVPLEDVAKALKLQTHKSGNQITLRPAGGAFQVANKLKGQQGEELFSGKWRFSVLNVTRTNKHERRYKGRYTSSSPIEAAEGEEIVVVECRIKNGTPQKTNFAFSTGEWAENTALTDQNENSYQPADYDILADESAPLGKWALPGSAVNFSVIFRVPKETVLKDLVYSVVEYRLRDQKKGTDFRVALKP